MLTRQKHQIQPEQYLSSNIFSPSQPVLRKHGNTMSVTQAALDALDDATLDLFAALQIRDMASIIEQNEDDDPATIESVAVGQALTEELLQYRAVRRFEKQETQLAEASAVAAAGGPANIQCAAYDDGFSVEEIW
jgi:hypothetical protein